MNSASVAVFLFCLCLTVGGCEDGAASEPGVPDSTLVAVLVDVYAATARAHLDGTDPTQARMDALAPFGLDTTDLNLTLAYLAENPDSASAVYQRALDSLIVIQRDLRSVVDLDSLQKHIRG